MQLFVGCPEERVLLNSLMFLQVKNILYHAVKEMVRALKIHESEMEDMEEN